MIHLHNYIRALSFERIEGVNYYYDQATAIVGCLCHEFVVLTDTLSWDERSLGTFFALERLARRIR